MEITAETLVADIAAHHPRSIEVFERHGIDFSLPLLGRMADKVAEVHGSRHPELRELAQVYRGLRDELTPHLTTEEEQVFPAVRRLVEPGMGEPDVQGAR